MKEFYLHRPVAEPPFEFVRPAARLAVGAVVAVAVVAAGFLVFGEFSDLSVLQLAAGPMATASGMVAPIVMARTGRDWGAMAAERQAAAASNVHVALRGERARR